MVEARHADPLLEHRRLGAMVAVATHPQAGHLYVCACGWVGWTAFSRAQRHADTCAHARRAPACTGCGHRLVRGLERRPSLACPSCQRVIPAAVPRRAAKGWK